MRSGFDPVWAIDRLSALAKSGRIPTRVSDAQRPAESCRSRVRVKTDPVVARRERLRVVVSVVEVGVSGPFAESNRADADLANGAQAVPPALLGWKNLGAALCAAMQLAALFASAFVKG